MLPGPSTTLLDQSWQQIAMVPSPSTPVLDQSWQPISMVPSRSRPGPRDTPNYVVLGDPNEQQPFLNHPVTQPHNTFVDTDPKLPFLDLTEILPIAKKSRIFGLEGNHYVLNRPTINQGCWRSAYGEKAFHDEWCYPYVHSPSEYHQVASVTIFAVVHRFNLRSMVVH